MGCGCKATVSENDPRAEIWMKVRGSRSFPLKHPVPQTMDTFPGKLFYVGDAAALTPEQKEHFIEAMMTKFKVSREYVLESIIDNQIPILAEHVIVTICNLHFRSCFEELLFFGWGVPGALVSVVGRWTS